MKLQRTDFAALGASLIFGLNFSSVKMALLYIPPFTMGVARFFLAAMVLLFLLRRIEGSVRVSRLHLPRMFCAGIICFGMQQICFLYGLRYIDASMGSLLNAFTTALMVLVASFVTRERLSPLVIVGVVIACLGMLCVLLGKQINVTFQAMSIVGCLLVFGSGVLGGILPMINKGALAHYSSLRVTTWTIIAGWLFFIPLESVSHDQVMWTQLSPLTWVAILFTAVGATATAHVLWNYGVAHGGLVRMTLYGYLPPILGILFATVLLHEYLNPFQWGGAALTLGGVFVSQYAKINKRVVLPDKPAECVKG